LFLRRPHPPTAGHAVAGRPTPHPPDRAPAAAGRGGTAWAGQAARSHRPSASDAGGGGGGRGEQPSSACPRRPPSPTGGGEQEHQQQRPALALPLPSSPGWRISSRTGLLRLRSSRDGRQSSPARPPAAPVAASPELKAARWRRSSRLGGATRTRGPRGGTGLLRQRPRALPDAVGWPSSAPFPPLSLPGRASSVVGRGRAGPVPVPAPGRL
ncbi:unnamed protein product, partial [Urochloa humidicola]